MNLELARIRERLVQQRAARNKEIADALERARQALRASNAGLADGDRVFDPETGQEGVIVGRTRENVVVPSR